MLANFLLKYRKLVVVIVVFILILFALLHIINNAKFHLISTVPATNNISYETTSLQVNFNKNIPNQTLLVQSTDNVVRSYSISNKTITFNLNSPTNTGNSYSINVVRVYDTNHNVINNLAIRFIPQNIPFQDLSINQQRQILSNQKPKNEVSFMGTEGLIGYGVTSDQISKIQTYILKFNPSTKNISFNVSNYSESKTNTNQGTTFTINYGVVVNGVSYKATSTFIGNNINLQLYNTQTNSLVYSSGSV